MTGQVYMGVYGNSLEKTTELICHRYNNKSNRYTQTYAHTHTHTMDGQTQRHGRMHTMDGHTHVRMHTTPTHTAYAHN